MITLKSGSRLKSQVDTTEVIVIRAPADAVGLEIGGHPAIDLTADPQSGLVPADGTPALVGKRYTREQADLEILVTKGGTASGLCVDGQPLVIKESKALPSSD